MAIPVGAKANYTEIAGASTLGKQPGLATSLGAVFVNWVLHAIEMRWLLHDCELLALAGQPQQEVEDLLRAMRRESATPPVLVDTRAESWRNRFL